MGIYHVDPSGGFGVADEGPDEDRVTIADWQAKHESPPFLMYAITRMSDGWVIPAARTELYGHASYRTLQWFTNIDEIRLVAFVQRPGGKGQIAMQWSNDVPANVWNSIDGAGGPSINVAKHGCLDSGWRPIAVGLKNFSGMTEVTLRIVGENGDGVIATNFGHIAAYVR